MSHFLRIMTQIREREHLVKSLRDLHYQFREGENLVVRGYAGNKERAEVVVDTQCSYDIGFRRRGELYEAVADWDYGVARNSPLRIDGQPIRRDNFLQQINRQYAYNVIRDQIQEQNLVVEEEQTLANGDVVITLSERG
ncbi:MAG: DUF1257 domain-containing protein [Phycisphaerae bacterium]|nr:DUF1257 domain-containing protein [Phycisphaerae bacterium]